MAVSDIVPSPLRIEKTGSRSGVVRESPIPLHAQMRGLIVAMIERGEIAPGHPFPPERQLAGEFGVSLAPVRQAILNLVREGVVYRVRGRGTFLAELSLIDQDSMPSSFSQSMRCRGLTVEMRILRDESVAADREIARALETRARRLGRLERLAVVEAEPVALMTSYYSPQRFPGLGAKLATRGSLHQVLEDDFAIVLARADMSVEAVHCTLAQSMLLQIPAGSTALLAFGTTYDAVGAPVEYFHALYRSDRIRLRLEARRYVESVAARPPSRSGRKADGTGKKTRGAA